MFYVTWSERVLSTDKPLKKAGQTTAPTAYKEKVIVHKLFVEDII